MHAKFLLQGGKAEWVSSEGRILLGDNIGDTVVPLQPVRFQCVGVWISTGLSCVYMYSRLSESSIPTSPGPSRA